MTMRAPDISASAHRGHGSSDTASGPNPPPDAAHGDNNHPGQSRAAEKELRRLLRTLDNGEHVDPTRMTVRQWLTRGLALCARRSPPKRTSAMRRSSRIPRAGTRRTPLPKLAPVHIQTAYTRRHGGRREASPAGSRPGPAGIFTESSGRTIPAPSSNRSLPAIRPTFSRSACRRSSAHPNHPHRGTISTAPRGFAHSRVYWPVLLALSTGCAAAKFWPSVGKTLILSAARSVSWKASNRRKQAFGSRHRKPAARVDHPPRLRHRSSPAEARTSRGILALGVRPTGDTLLCARADGKPHQPLSLTYEFARFIGRMKDAAARPVP